MATYGDALLKKTQRGFSILAFETTKQSRILKKRMRIAALQKEIKADLRDLGNLVYNAMINQQPGILEEEEVKILVQNVRNNKAEVERLRDSIGRLGRAKKHFVEGEEFEEGGPGPSPDEEPGVVVVETGPRPESPRDVSVDSERELKEAVLQSPTLSDLPKQKGDGRKASVPPAPGADLEAASAGESSSGEADKPST